MEIEIEQILESEIQYRKLIDSDKNLIYKQRNMLFNRISITNFLKLSSLTFIRDLLKVDKIQCRIAKKSRFSQPQLWYLLYSLINAKLQFLNSSINLGNIGDLSTKNVFISQKGQIKISNILSFPNQQTNYKKCQENSEDEQFFLSPEDILNLQLGSINNDSNIFSQYFSIGLIVISCGIIDLLSDIYDMNKKKFNFFVFNQKINSWKDSKYSQILIATVLSLCEIEPTHRTDCQQIYRMLSSNQSSIKKKKAFTIENPSQKIQNMIKKIREQKKKINLNVHIQNFLQKQSNEEKSMVNSHSSSNKKQELSIGKYSNSKKIGSQIRLTQAILDPPSPFIPGKQEVPSLFSSTDIVVLKKIQSTNLPPQPLKRYQQINENQKIKNNEHSQTSIQYEQPLKTSNSYIVQQPVIFDKNRPSDDIQQEITPTSTPLQQTIKNQQFLNQVIFQQALGLSDQSSAINVVKNKNLVTQEITVTSPRKIRQAKSFDPENDQKKKATPMLHSHKVNQQQKKQSENSNKQSSSSQFLSLEKQSKFNQNNFQQLIKTTQQIDVNENQVLNELQNQKKEEYKQKNTVKKKVQFQYQEGNSELLQIEDIDLQHIKGQKEGDQSFDNILIHYKQKNHNEEVIEKIALSKTNPNQDKKEQN